MAELIGQHLGNYRVTALLGEGGMASVYRARQVNIDRDVAIKVIDAKLARSPEFLKRFEREARTIASLNHAHILKLFDFGQHEDTIFLVMELLMGGSLAAQVRQGPLPVGRAAEILDQIASALDYAHQKGIVHRDLKPQNVLFDEAGQAHLTDFGIAKIVGDATTLTMSGMAMGTPMYMAPEQWQGADLDSRSDVYSLGVMLYEMLSGQTPFLADTPASLMYKHLLETPPSLQALRPELPAGVEAVLSKAMAKNRDRRFSSAGEVAAAFRLVLVGQPVPGLEDEADAAGLTSPVAVGSTPPRTPAHAPLAEVGRSEPPRRGISRSLLAIGVLLIAAVVVGAVLILSGAGRGAEPTASASTATHSVASAPTLTITSTFTVAATPDAPGTEAAIVAMTGTAVAAFTDTPSATTTPTSSHTASLTPSATPSSTVTATASAATETETATQTATATASFTQTFTPTHTSSLTPSRTPTPTHTFTPTRTMLPEPTATETLMPSSVTSVVRNADWKPMVRSFDGVEMVLVPPGCFMMGSDGGGDTDELPAHRVCISAPFWIDKYEVSQAQFRSFDGRQERTPMYQGDDLPLETVTWFEAQEYCTMRGGSLPSEAEWEFAARGPDSRTYPWGNSFRAERVVNIVNAYNQPAAVGSIEANGSWVGALDMSGNVTEWTYSLYLPFPYRADDGREADTGRRVDVQRVTRGGGWNMIENVLRAADRMGIPPTDVADNMGFRCARAYLQDGVVDVPAQAAPAATTDARAATLIPAGTSNSTWTPVRRDFGGIPMVHVPAGCFTMGSDSGDPNEVPAHEVCIDHAFWIGETEVTNKQFGSSNTSQDDDLPRARIDIFMAQAFCAARGERLPTEAEWEYAARGPESWVYPWGNEFTVDNVALGDDPSDTPLPVGSRPAGASWVGALDMVGNVWEFVSTLYGPYPYDPGREDWRNRTDQRVERGGSYLDSFEIQGAEVVGNWLFFRAAKRSGWRPEASSVNIGFRCVRDDRDN